MNLKTLGGLALEDASLTRPKPLLMLAYMTLNGPTTRRELADVFFHDADDARDSLSTSLRHLRRAGAVEGLPDDRIASRVGSDASRLLHDFDAYRYESVLRAYAGPFLDGIDVGLGLELESWLFTTREAIARRVRSAALHRARAALAEDRRDEARRLATLAVTLRGAPEFEMDELADALPVLERLALPEAAQMRELAESYGLELERPRLATAEPPRRTAGPSLQRNTAFVGREAELRELEDRLRDPDARLVTLFGMGGVGKTRLALRLAERQAALAPERYPEGIVVVALETVDRPGDVVPAIASRLALPATAGASAVDLAEALAGWRALLVLDNLDHVVEAASDVGLLLRGCPGLQLVVTSRVRLGLVEERTFELAGLSTTRSGGKRSDAASLFVERAERVGYAPEAARRDEDAIEDLCGALEGYPLGIELAAAMTRALSVAEIRTSLDDALDVLAHGPVDAPSRHRAVRAVLEPSWTLLDATERDALLRLAEFRTSFQFDAAAAVGGVSLPLLLRLVDHAVLRSEGSGRGRFGFHPVMLAFLRERSAGAPREAARSAHRRFYAGLLTAAVARVQTEPHEVLDRLEADLPDVVHAARGWLAAGEVAPAVAMTRALVVDADYLQARAGGPESIALVRAVAEAAEGLGDWAGAERLWTKAANAVRTLLGDADEAARLYARALGLAERHGDIGRTVMLHAILGAVLDERAPAAAEAHLATARRLAEEADDDLMRCEVLQRGAYVACRRRDWQRARDLNAEAIAIAERLVASEGADQSRVTSLLFYCLLNRGTAEDELGAVAASVTYRRRALEVAEATGHDLWAAYARHDLALALHALEETDEARRYATEALRLYDLQGAAGDRAAVAGLLSAWGDGEPSR